MLAFSIIVRADSDGVACPGRACTSRKRRCTRAKQQISADAGRGSCCSESLRQFLQLWGVLVALGGLPQSDLEEADEGLWEQEHVIRCLGTKALGHFGCRCEPV